MQLPDLGFHVGDLRVQLDLDIGGVAVETLLLGLHPLEVFRLHALAEPACLRVRQFGKRGFWDKLVGP